MKRFLAWLKKRKKIVLIVALSAVGLIVAAYLGLCAYVSGTSTVLPGVRVGEAQLGGLTQQQAPLSRQQAEWGGGGGYCRDCLEQRGWQVGTCDPGDTWVLVCW